MNRLPPDLFQQCQSALLDAFRTKSDLEQMARVQLDQNLDAIAGGIDLTEITRRLIDWAESQGKLTALIDGALAQNPDNPLLVAFKATYDNHAALNASSTSSFPQKLGETERGPRGGQERSDLDHYAPVIRNQIQATREGDTKIDLSNLQLDFVPEEIATIFHVKELDLSDNQLTKIPEFIGGMTNLAHLDLSYNQLTEIPEFIGGMTNLAHLDLSYNQLTEIPEFIGGMTNLAHLDLRSNQLTEIPEFIGGMTNLAHLDLRSNQLTEIPEFIGGMTNLVHLYLSYNQLTEIPEFIGGMTNLVHLYLSGSQLTEIPEFIGGMTNLAHLYLSDNQLTEVPESITNLTSLTQLNLRSNQLTEVPESITNLTSLTQLNLRSNQLTEVPESITKLTNLTQLDLRSNQLTEVPESITNLTSLTQLYLSDNQLTEVPESITKLTSLTQLYLSNTKLTEVPESITKLTNLTQLDLRFNQLTEVPESITNLTNLTQLDLRFNQVTEVPESITNLTNLTQLYLSNTKLTEVPESITNLTNLTQLDLRDNQLTEVPESITTLTNLTQLDLSGNQLTEVPESITTLTNLTQLDLSYNQLTEVPESITTLTNLTQLDLRNNQLTEVPESITQLSLLRALRVNNNEIALPPKEAVDLGGDYNSVHIQQLWRYYQQLEEEGTAQLYEAKVLIVGEPGAGKTSLAHKIEDPNYQLQPEEKSTEGIDVLRWSFQTKAGQQFDVNIWDFGGQEIYHATHQFFLTRRSVYLLVSDERKENTDFHYWLDAVDLLSDGSPLLIIKNERQDRSRQIDEARLRGRFANLQETLATNLETNRGLEQIVAKVQHYLEGLEHVGTELPKSWVNVRRALEENPANYISQDAYLQICTDNGFDRHADALMLSGYLHDLGVCLHFQDDPTLKHRVILKPTWGTDAVYRVLDNETVKGNFGRFTRQDLALIWHEDEYANMRDELLRLMINFQLCYQIQERDEYIAPQLLGEAQPRYNWDEQDNLILRYKYDFMPKGILSRFIVATHDRIVDQRLVWLFGVVLRDGAAQAQVIEDLAQKEMRVRISGRYKGELLGIVRNQLGHIHKSLPKLRVQELIPCCCPTCTESQEPHPFPYQILRQFMEDNQPEIQCQRSYKMVSVSELLVMVDGFADRISIQGGDGHIDYYDFNDRRRAHAKGPSAQTTRAKAVVDPEIFISYAWKDRDEDVAESREAIVNAVCDTFGERGYRIHRDKTVLGYKESIKEFMQQLGRGNYVIVVVSDKYLKSENCMYEAYQMFRASHFRERVFPIVLGEVDIYSIKGQTDYLVYWGEQLAEIQAQAERLQNINPTLAVPLLERRKDIEQTTYIINDFMAQIADMNVLTEAMHIESGFEALIEAIEVRIKALDGA